MQLGDIKMQWYICCSWTPEPDAIQTLNTFQKRFPLIKGCLFI